MRIKLPDRQAGRAAFSLIEVMVASALAALMFLLGMTGLSSCFQIVAADRENSRAIQLMLEKTEVLHLYTWNQVTGNDSNTYIPTTFTAPFYPGTNGTVTNGGFTYSGSVTITNAPITESYSNDLRQVTIAVTWKSESSGNVTRSRSMTTFVSHYGIQNYIQ